MTTDLQQACTDLAQALPLAAALLTQHDTQTSSATRTKPSSKPPWNPEAANALFDALEGIQRLNQNLALENGHHDQRRSYRHTGHTLRSIERRATALDEHAQRETERQLTRWRTTIEQLPAVDQTPKWSRLPVACRCGTEWLYVARQSGAVHCAYPDCGLTGRLELGRFGRQLVWNDGVVWEAA